MLLEVALRTRRRVVCDGCVWGGQRLVVAWLRDAREQESKSRCQEGAKSVLSSEKRVCFIGWERHANC